MKQPVPIFSASVVDKKLKMTGHVKKAIALWVSTFANGADLDIVIRKRSKQRTSLQNRYYWGTVVPILADFFGHDNPEDMHEDLKLEFNPTKSKINSDKIIGGTTTKLSTIEFYHAEDSYVERICRWAATEYGIYIPPPKKAE